jgi:DNA-directed RNA polymerase subunit RPC12/RpoP
MHKYRCAHCKVETTTINGKLEGHLPSCAYRIKLEHTGYEATGSSIEPASSFADEVD